jgi:hypothetical protein
MNHGTMAEGNIVTDYGERRYGYIFSAKKCFADICIPADAETWFYQGMKKVENLYKCQLWIAYPYDVFRCGIKFFGNKNRTGIRIINPF